MDLGVRRMFRGSGGVGGGGGGGCLREKEREVAVEWWGLWVRRVVGVRGKCEAESDEMLSIFGRNWKVVTGGSLFSFLKVLKFIGSANGSICFIL